MKNLILLIVFSLYALSCSEITPGQGKESRTTQKSNFEIFLAPDTTELLNDDWGNLVKYGKRLVQNTSYYIGPEGVESKNLHNKMNCTNCHLNNGTKPYGLNFFNSHKSYPQYRARENKVLSLADRVNNCIERPHSGTALELDSKEMIAIISYIKWLGEDYEPEKHEGYGLKQIEYKGLEADSKRGEVVYIKHCQSCHMQNGEGLMNADTTTYTYPPLWGDMAYQEGSSMHRVLKAASFIKYNMPNITSWDKPLLSDQEALDVAAFINDGDIHARPKSKYTSYENIKTKPIDYFKGPYVDSFPEKTHAFGPWDGIVNFYESKGIKTR